MNGTLKKVSFVVATLAVIAVIIYKVMSSLTFQFFGEIVSKVNTSERVVALTFDDGPTKQVDEVLSILRESGVRATFFVNGYALAANMPYGRMIAAAGHELGNHSYTHGHMVFTTVSEVRQEVESTDSLIRQTGYTGEILFRPPYGKKLFALPYYLSKTHRKTIMWNIAPEIKPSEDDSAKIVGAVMSNIQPGSIILMHVMFSSRKNSIRALRGIITTLQHNGYRFATVSELMTIRSR